MSNCVIGSIIISVFSILSAKSNNSQVSNYLYLTYDESSEVFINSSGRIVIKDIDGELSPFVDGLALVKVGTEKDGNHVDYGGKYGYINMNGAFQITPQFDIAHSFHDNMACVAVGGEYRKISPKGFNYEYVNGAYGYIDKNGKYRINPQYYYARDFYSGLAAIQENEKGKWAFINKNGNILIPQQFDEAYNFSEGLACVKIADKFGYIDTAGKLAIKPQFDEVDWGVFGSDDFSNTGSFSEGLACVAIGKDSLIKYGFIDKNGKYIIEPKFRAAHSFHDGLACVAEKSGSKWGFIDKTGNFVIKPQFEVDANFYEGIACVSIGGSDIFQRTWGYINKAGKYVINPKFHPVYPRADHNFHNGIARIDEQGKEVLLNKSGTIIWNPYRLKF